MCACVCVFLFEHSFPYQINKKSKYQAGSGNVETLWSSDAFLAPRLRSTAV